MSIAFDAMYNRKQLQYTRSSTACRVSKAPRKTQKRNSPPKNHDLECQHFALCSGCTIDSNLHTPPVLNEAENFFASVGYDGFRLHAGDKHGWRCRVKLAVRGTARKPVLGLFQKRSHTAISIPDCKVHHPSINQVVSLILQLVRAVSITPYSDDTHTGVLRYLQLTVAPEEKLPLRSNSKALVQVVLVCAVDHTAQASAAYLQCLALAEQLWALGGTGPLSPGPLLHSVSLNFQPSPTSNSILGPHWRHLHGPPFMWLHYDHYSVAFAPGSFIQSNYNAAARCAKQVAHHVPAAATVTELYAGVGALGIAVAALSRPSRLRLVEANLQCEAPFTASRQLLPQGVDITYHVASAADDATHWLEDTQVLIVDPPRRGLDQPLLNLLCSLPAADKTSQSSELSDLAAEMPSLLGHNTPIVVTPQHAASSESTDTQRQTTKLPNRLHSTSQTTSSGTVNQTEALLATAATAGSPASPSSSTRTPLSTVRQQTAALTQPRTTSPVAVRQLPIQRLVYVSCGFSSFQRDCRALLSSGTWTLQSAQALLYFPGTDAVETLAVFDRAGAGS